MRYHSLIVERKSIPACFVVTAETAKNYLVMAIQHREFPLYGIQFHPESIGTPVGKIILRNFLRVNSKNAIMRPCRRHVCSAVRHLQ